MDNLCVFFFFIVIVYLFYIVIQIGRIGFDFGKIEKKFIISLETYLVRSLSDRGRGSDARGKFLRVGRKKKIIIRVFFCSLPPPTHK